MAKPRTGTLVYRKTSGWNGVVTVDVDGVAKQKWIAFDTHDRVLAKRKLAKVVAQFAAGELESAEAARVKVNAAPTVQEAAEEWLAGRAARGVAMVGSERGYFAHHIFPEIGMVAVTEVSRPQLRRVLEAARARDLSKETVAHLRRLLVRFFRSVEEDEVIKANPMRLVSMPPMKSDRRPFTLPTDAEVVRVLESPEVDVEIKLLLLVARTLGGARGAEVNRWTWQMIDLETFETCRLARAKGDDVQDFVIPPVLSVFVREWWKARGEPTSGPVFPVVRGDRKGEARGRSTYAQRVRRAFLRAGVDRRELHEDTEHSRKLNFHSMRRAFVSSLAEVGTNEQTAMALAHHADSRIHKRYQMGLIRDLPAGAALPGLDPSHAVRIVAPAMMSEKETRKLRAGHGIRTRDIQLGKLALYQLS
jgi:site-specific recombinase XerC